MFSKIIGDVVSSFWPRMITRLYTLLLSSTCLNLGKGVRIVPPLRFTNSAGIKIGRDVYVGRGCWIQIVNDKKRMEEHPLIIDDYSKIGMGATISAAKNIYIGKSVLFARNVFVSDHAHHYSVIHTPISEQGIFKETKVAIGDGSWIGQNAVILPGANIGRNCVIGANSVVNIHVPDYCIAAGVPARIIKAYNQSTGKWENKFE